MTLDTEIDITIIEDILVFRCASHRFKPKLTPSSRKGSYIVYYQRVIKGNIQVYLAYYKQLLSCRTQSVR